MHRSCFYYKGGSTSGQSEANTVFWLATRAGKMDLSCTLGITCFKLSHKKRFCCGNIIKRLPTKLVWSRSLNTFALVFFCAVGAQKKTEYSGINNPNPRAWPLTLMYKVCVKAVGSLYWLTCSKCQVWLVNLDIDWLTDWLMVYLLKSRMCWFPDFSEVWRVAVNLTVTPIFWLF